jgi:hypothetical protein
MSGLRCEGYRPSRRSNAPMPPWAAATSAAANTRCLYSPVNVRRFASTTTSGSGRTGGTAAGASGVVPAPLRSTSLRSASLRSAGTTPDEEPKTTTLCFTLMPHLALLSNCGQESCFSYVGTEGSTRSLRSLAQDILPLVACHERACRLVEGRLAGESNGPP